MKGWIWVLAYGLLLTCGSVSAQEAPAGAVRDGITFADEPGVLYVPVREAAADLGWRARWNAKTETALLEGQPVSDARTRFLPGGTTLVALRDLEQWGAAVSWDAERNAARVSHEARALWVRNGEKRVAVNRAAQMLRTWQGERLVLETNVSTGARGHETPTGTFAAGPYRAEMHYSSLYENAPMPWSVQINGNIFFHGYHSVPRYPASHGCVRVPLSGENPAKWVYEWIDTGTPVVIADGWPEDAPSPQAARAGEPAIHAKRR